jgi:hypothetical protein
LKSWKWWNKAVITALWRKSVPLPIPNQFDRQRSGERRCLQSREYFQKFHARLVAKQFDESYEAAHARLILDCAHALFRRNAMRRAGSLQLLPEASQIAADKSFVETVLKLCDGLEATLKSYQNTTDTKRRKLYELWRVSAGAP